ncbi:hypothetical protein GGTG_01681 [Gaeumannomyces tritici R3-111a-1]|uniref:Uncharacterized protein n=1 Tax=Gaeumannomyces tritici (strain R3-111a-1) TaxID=644352 RepID=J3NKA1_GAET3|nr:hypothetical protein GGTG_01681 [Gaeumannomyces tritici R3-111a-1]EJT81705.1 hypothetical protein GGTG_01681 [Gaeumannomyces tritici R3-111a-1]
MAFKAKIILEPHKRIPGDINILTFKKPVICFKCGQLNYIVAICKIRTDNPETPLALATIQRAKRKKPEVRYYGYGKLGYIRPACPKKSKISPSNSIPLFGRLSTEV